MTDVHTVASTPADHERTHRRHIRTLWTAGILGAVALVFAVWFFQDPIAYYGQRGVATIVSHRPTVDRIPVVPAQSPATPTTQLATTDDHRVVVVETKQRTVDVMSDLEAAKKAAEDAKEQLAAMTQKVAAAAKESDALKTVVASLKTSIDNSTAMGKEYLNFVKERATRASETQSQNAAPAPEKPQASNGSPTKVADAGDTTLVVRKGFHVVSQGDDANAARAGACKPPHRLVVSNQCISAGYNDPVTHKPVQRCKNICE